MVSDLSRKPPLMLLFVFLLFSFFLPTFYANATISSSIGFEINQVEHVVRIEDGGLVIIEDTINISLVGESAQPRNFPIGFPFEYSPHLVYCFAHNSSDPTERLEVTLDTGLGKIGFYGINVTLPANVFDKDSYTVTVVFVFSDLIYAEPPILEPDVYFWWNLTFPIYPSLTQMASICNVTVIFPPVVGMVRAEWHSNLVEKGLNVSSTSIDHGQVLQFSKTNLENLASESAWVRFYQFSPVEPFVFLMIDADEAKRDITLDNWGSISISDFYHLTNKGEWNLTNIKLRLPQYAFDVSWIDEAGHIHEQPPLEGNATTPHINATISFGTSVEKNEEIEFTVTYWLPWKEYVTQSTWRNFNLAFNFFERERIDWIIKKLSVTINLPNDADFQSCSVPPQSVEKLVSFSFHNVTSFHDLDFHLTYEYVIFWASFHPTIWVGLLVTVACVIAFLWRAPKPPRVPVIPVSTESLRSFVDTHERKASVIRELEMLEQQVRKRKIPRRRYKVRKKALEGRHSVLSKDLADLKEDIRKAGSRYASTMRQIEVAETELDETEAAIRRIELRYRRREISKETYRKLLEEYNRRKERAETTIDGVLLRLREEIR
jgi:hypothetical protein